MDKVKLRRLPLYVLARIIALINTTIDFFKRDVYVAVDYLYTGKNKEIYEFRIYICRFNKCHMISSIPWEYSSKLIDLLESAPGKIELDVDHGMVKEVLLIPKWAKKSLAQKLKEAV